MATAEEALVARLRADAGVLALVGARIYPLITPQDVLLPAIAYQRISNVIDRAQDGFATRSVTRFQLTCQANSYSGVKALAVACRRALESWVGAASDPAVMASFVDNESDGYGDNAQAPVVRMDVLIHHKEI